MDNFPIAWDYTGHAEAGWADNAGDRGGETIFGVSRVAHPEWLGWAKVDAARARPDFPACVNADQELLAMALQLYRESYWNAVHGDELPLPMAVAVFDMAVNSNPPPAIRNMQAALRVDVDGVIGQKTIKTAYDQGLQGVLNFLKRRLEFYKEDWEKCPTDEKWAEVWFDRIVELTAYVTRLDLQGGTK